MRDEDDDFWKDYFAIPLTGARAGVWDLEVTALGQDPATLAGALTVRPPLPFNRLGTWGGPDGFDGENRLEIPSIGVHYDVGIDLGHIKDRSFVYTYESSLYEARGKRPVKINWEAETPHRTSVKLQIRSARSKRALARAKWQGPGGENTVFTQTGSSIEGISGNNWIQYRALLDTDNGASSPVLNSVELTFE